jgi:hypothetical protein
MYYTAASAVKPQSHQKHIKKEIAASALESPYSTLITFNSYSRLCKLSTYLRVRDTFVLMGGKDERLAVNAVVTH